MKHMTKLLLTAALAGALLLSGCASAPSESGAGYTKEQAQEILDSDIFTDTQMEEFDLDGAFELYQLNSAGLIREQLTDGVVYYSTGTFEQVALLCCADSSAAASAKQAMESYIESTVESIQDYPLWANNIPKLEDAFLQQSGDTVLLVVSNDSQAVSALLG